MLNPVPPRPRGRRATGGGLLLALDQGTTSTRAVLFDERARRLAIERRPLAATAPGPGRIEHDPEAIWRDAQAVIAGVLARAGVRADALAAIGIANQRETVMVWDRATGGAIHPAISWQDRRTAERCRALAEGGAGPVIRARTGLVIDPYFSATKLRWILDAVPGAREAAERGRLAFGTVDAFLLWRLTDGAVHATDATNASRTQLFNLHRGGWDEALLDLFGIPRAMMPAIVDSAGVVGHVAPALFGAPVPIAGIAGDQQAALFGQACLAPGMAKATYGTGCFLLRHTGTAPAIADGTLATVACRLDGALTYAQEGAIFAAGSALGWLRDGLGVLRDTARSEAMARAVPDDHGVYLVPAFGGLGAPHWDPQARGLLCGLTAATTPAHLVRAALEAIAYQTLDLVEAMGGCDRSLRVDGGVSANGWFCRFLADMLGHPVERSAELETTALGAALLAGLGVGIWPDPPAAVRARRGGRVFEPVASPSLRAERIAGWRDALARSRARPAAAPS